jgi:hypothetical protein
MCCVRGIHHDHAEAERMSLAFIQDRIDTDDPMRGYTVRTDDSQVCYTCAMYLCLSIYRSLYTAS